MWEITDRLLQFLGVVSSTGTTDGSVVDAAFEEPDAEPFCITYSLDNDPYLTQPEIDITGDTLSWTWTGTGDAAYRTPCRLIYGIK